MMWVSDDDSESRLVGPYNGKKEFVFARMKWDDEYESWKFTSFNPVTLDEAPDIDDEADDIGDCSIFESDAREEILEHLFSMMMIRRIVSEEKENV